MGIDEQARILASENGGVWGEHAEHPVTDWQYEAANGETRLGYWAWVANQIDMAESA